MMAQPGVAALHGITPPVPVISPQFCCPYPVDLAIVINAVTDTNGTLLFQVKEKFLTLLHEKKTILDALGNPIVTLRRKAMSMHSRWQVFRGASTHSVDLIFTAKTHSVFYLKTKLDVFLAHNTAEKVCDFKVKGSYLEQSCVVYAGDHEDSNTIVAQMHKKHTAKSIFLGKDQFMVTVYPNMDHAFIVALIVILDEINHQGNNPVPVISPQFCCPYPVDLAIVRNAVTDTNGTLLFLIKEKFLTLLHEKKTILDALGNPIVTLRRKAMSMHSRWQVFRGASTHSKDLIFTAKTDSVFYLKTKLDVFLAHNTAEKVCDFKVKGSYLEQSCVVYAGDHEDSNTIVAQRHKTHTAKSIFLGKDQFMVTVYPNMDHAFMVALIVILDEINRQGRDVASDVALLHPVNNGGDREDSKSNPEDKN